MALIFSIYPTTIEEKKTCKKQFWLWKMTRCLDLSLVQMIMSQNRARKLTSPVDISGIAAKRGSSVLCLFPDSAILKIPAKLRKKKADYYNYCVNLPDVYRNGFHT
jgi:hypothetical protein